MASKTYLFRPEKKFFKQGSILLDENKEIIYQAKMLKWTLFRPYKFEFVNNITKASEEHMVGHTVTSQLTSGDFTDAFSVKSAFKYDGKNIWDYLHELGFRIATHLSGKGLGLTYTVTLKGKPFATIATANANGKQGFITTNACLNVTCDEEDIALAFLVAFSIARTDQGIYD